MARSGSRYYQGIARDWEEDIIKMPIPIHKFNNMKNLLGNITITHTFYVEYGTFNVKVNKILLTFIGIF